MPFDSPNFRMADRLTDGHLDTILTGYRAGGLSLSATNSRLYADHGIEVSLPTLARWISAALTPERAA